MMSHQTAFILTLFVVFLLSSSSYRLVSLLPFRSAQRLLANLEGNDSPTHRAPFFSHESPSRFTAETCFIVGVEDRIQSDPFDSRKFTMSESMSELVQLAEVAGLKVVGSTYQRLNEGPSPQYYIGSGKSKEIARIMGDLQCQCVVFDADLTPSQQKNLEQLFNTLSTSGKMRRNAIKVIDRTALILDIFAQHAGSREGQLQVELAMLTYRLPRLTKLWSHLERQTASSKGGRSSGGVGLRGPGEQQLEADRRQMKAKISQLNRDIDMVRLHRSLHRRRRKDLGVPTVALVGYTNSGKSTLLNALTRSDVFVADMLFATLDPTTRLVKVDGLTSPRFLLTDTVGFIQKLPTHLIAAFRATLEEIVEADILLHVTDVSNEAWRKQEAAVLTELAHMGLADKPLITVWNKADLLGDRLEGVMAAAKTRNYTATVSAVSGLGLPDLLQMVESVLRRDMRGVVCHVPYDLAALKSLVYSLGVVQEERLDVDFGFVVVGKIPLFLLQQLQEVSHASGGALRIEVEGGVVDGGCDGESRSRAMGQEFDENYWKRMGKGRHH